MSFCSLMRSFHYCWLLSTPFLSAVSLFENLSTVYVCLRHINAVWSAWFRVHSLSMPFHHLFLKRSNAVWILFVNSYHYYLICLPVWWIPLIAIKHAYALAPFCFRSSFAAQRTETIHMFIRNILHIINSRRVLKHCLALKTIRFISRLLVHARHLVLPRPPMPYCCCPPATPAHVFRVCLFMPTIYCRLNG